MRLTCDLKYDFISVMIICCGAKDARVFTNSQWNTRFKNGHIPALKKRIVEDEEPVPIFLLGDLAYPLLPFLMKKYANVGCNVQEQYFG